MWLFFVLVLIIGLMVFLIVQHQKSTHRWVCPRCGWRLRTNHHGIYLQERIAHTRRHLNAN